MPLRTGSSGPSTGSSGQARNRLSHFWNSSLEGSRNFSPEVPPGNFWWSGNSGLLAGSSGPGNFPVEFWLSHFGFSSREGSWRFWAEVLPGDFWPTGSSGHQAGSSGPRPEFPVHNTGISGPALFQRPDFLEGYKYPSTYLGTLSSCNSLSSLKAKAQIEEISQFLHRNSLIFGGLKEKTRIYIFTKPFFISPSFI